MSYPLMLSYHSFQPVPHNWYNKVCGMYYPVCGMYYPVCGMVQIKVAANLKDQVHIVVAVGFLSHYLSGPFPCLMPYHHK